MIENVASLASNIKVRANDNDYKLGHREYSQGSNSSSLNKFLKRKPDHKKLLMGPPSKKKKDNSISDYFALNSQQKIPLSDSISEVRFQTDRFISNKHEYMEDSKSRISEGQLMLESAKSQNNIFAKRNQIGLLTNRKIENTNKIMKESILSKDSKQSSKHLEQGQSLVSKMQDYKHFGSKQIANYKKSKTQFFNFEQLRGISDQSNDILNKIDTNQLNSTRQCGDLSQQYQKLKCQCETLMKKSKLLQEQIQLCNQRNYLLSTQKKHLEEMLKEKDKIIDRLQREKSLFKQKGKSESDQTQKYKQEIKTIKNHASKLQQTYTNLTQQIKQLQNQINNKNEQLILVYDQYTDLQAKYRKEHDQMLSKLDKMKQDLDKVKHQQSKQDNFDFSQINQAEKMRQKLLKQQQEIRYLQIQNQCLLISKDQLCKSQSQNRKLRDERDYFKMRIMQNIRKNKKPPKQFSRSDNTSLVLQLSDISIN